MNLEAMLSQVLDELEQSRQERRTLLEAIDELKKIVSPEKSKLIGIPETALMLDVSENTVRSWLENNKMPKNLGIGKHVKFERLAIEKMAKARNVGRPRK